MTDMKNRYLIILILFSFILIFPEGASAEVVYINNAAVDPGGQVTLPISIGVVDPAGLGAATVTLFYDPGVVQVITANDSDFDSLTPNIQNTSGYTRILANQLGAAGIGPGTVRFANITLLSVGQAGGSSQLGLVVATLKNNNGQDVSYTVANGTFSINAPSDNRGNSGGGGGGGGGGGASGENYTNIEVKEKYDKHIFKDKVTSYAFTNDSNPIIFVNITGNVNAGEVNTAVEVLRNTSLLVKFPAPGVVYKNVNIWVGTSGFAVPRNIKEAVIVFKVRNSWLGKKKLAFADANMVKWDRIGWVVLETSEKSRDDEYTYYEAKTDSFSPFAITVLPGDVFLSGITTETKAPVIRTPAIEETVIPTTVPPKKVIEFKDFLLVIDMLFVIVIILSIYFIKKRKDQ